MARRTRDMGHGATMIVTGYDPGVRPSHQSPPVEVAATFPDLLTPPPAPRWASWSILPDPVLVLERECGEAPGL